MRTYYIETYNGVLWTKQARPYISCAKAHRAVKRLQQGAAPARVVMVMKPVSLKDLRLALAARRG